MPLSILSSTHACTIPVPCPASSHCPDCTELDNISKKLALLQNRQAEIYEKVNARRDLMTSKLPIEVICHIFEDYVSLHQVNEPPELVPLSEDIHVEFPQYFDTFHRSAPLRLGSVCRRWRQIAWSYPKLWNTLLFPVDIKAHRHGPAMVSDWLDRSKSLPLRIKGERGLEPHDYENNVFDDAGVHLSGTNPFDSALSVITVINKHSDRWLSLDFMDVDSDLTQSLGACPAPHLSNLRHLSAHKAYPLPSSHNFPETARPYNGLTHLSITCCDEDLAVRVDRLSSLTHIILDDIGTTALWNVAFFAYESRAPIMVFAAYNIYEDSEGGGEDNPPNVFPFLHTLSLTANDRWCRLNPLLDHLELPALRTLRYTAQANIAGPDAISSLIQRSGCDLDHIILEDARDSSYNLERVFRLTPNLSKLTASFTTSQSSWLMSQLNRNNTTGDTNVASLFLPLLKHIHVTAPHRSCWAYLQRGGTIADLPQPGSFYALNQRLSKFETVEYVQNDDDVYLGL